MDIYFRKEYGCLYEEAEGGVCETFDFDDPLGHVRHMFIKREIKAAPGFYDLVTPYGYGGPLITRCPEERIHYVPGKAVGNASSGKAMGNAVPGRAESDAARGRTAGNTSPDKAAEDSVSGRAESDAASDMTAENRDCEDTGSPDRRPGSEREYPGRKALSAAFGQAFSEYCRENNIVSEFIRFDPVTENALDFREVYGAEYNRHTLITDLRGDDPVTAEFTKSCRKNVRKAMRAGVSFETVTGPGDLKVFKDIYYDTMDRDRAADYYYFGDDYFSRLSGILGDELLMITAYFEGKAIASGIYFIDMDNMTLHVHLSGTLKEYLYLSPAYVLRYALALWGKENGFSMIHHGGGTSSSPEDPLFLFKKQFSGDRFLDFYIGRKIWNPEMYESLCERVGVPEGTGFFPAYRALESGRA